MHMEEYVDWDFVKSIFSPVDLYKNLGTSRRKQFFAFVYILLIIILGLFALRRGPVLVNTLHAYVEYSILALAIVLYSVEPLFLLLQSIVLAHPAVDAAKDLAGQPAETTDDIAVIISCHRSADVVVRTVHACIKHLRPNQIFVMDNANFPDPPDNTREVLEEADLHEVNYIYNPYGNKTLAMYGGVVAAKDFKYLLLIDDDVIVPDNMHFGKHLFSESVKAVCYPIQAVHPETEECTGSIFVEWQAIEYKMADYSKLLQNEFSTVLFPHGAICLWERSTLINCFRAHDTVFYADDVKMGMWFQRNGFEMKLHSRTMCKTDAPTTYVGPYPNYYNQRVRSWDMAEHVYAYEFFRLLFATRHKTFQGTLVLKWFQFYSCYSIVADWMRIPVMVLSLLVNPAWFWKISFIFVAGYTGLVIFWDRFGYRNCPDRQSRLWALLTFQFYKIPAVLIRLLGMIRAFTVFLPNYQAKPTIPELEQVVLRARDPDALPKKPVWMDRGNPYYEHYRPSNPAAVTRPISPLENPDELETIPEVDFEDGSPPPNIVPRVPLSGHFGRDPNSKPEILLVPPRKLFTPGGLDMIPEYIPRSIAGNDRFSSNDSIISGITGGLSLFQDDTSELSLPTALQSIRETAAQSIREQMAGEFSREEAAKRKEAARKRIREIEQSRSVNPGEEDNDDELGDEMEDGLPKVLPDESELTEDITDSQSPSHEDYISSLPTPSPAVPPLPANLQRPRQKIRYTAIQ